MFDNKFLMFENRLQKVYKHLSKSAKNQNITCYRIYDHDLPEFPLCIEKYEDYVYVAEYRRNHTLTDELYEAWHEESKKVISKILNTPIEKIYTKLRKRKTDKLDQYQKTNFLKEEFVVKENGHSFYVNLSDYLDTGLFLDHRTTRKMVQEKSMDKRVLNLFSYTGSFSVYAANGGASKVTTVDLSNTYINWAKRNFELNQLKDETKYEFIVADVLQYLFKIDSHTYDIIVMDPPTFSNSKKMNAILDIQRDHISLINQCLKILKPGGSLYFSTNFTKFKIEVNKINSTQIKDITKATTPFDFTNKLKRWCYLIDKK
ncbi:MAG: methyltransferase domain-containing protein [Chitinophagaceae bacterium]|nr:MAG: methyltransferase domain-containing protein [Chitinophagaceae bacterium]